MRIAFHAPLKPADHAVPSGDREVTRGLLRALRKATHEVHIASRLRTFDGTGDAARQERIRRAGARIAARYIERHRANPPDLWFTYHLYHKAPDWIGPAVSRALGIPYVVAEASYAPKQAGGPWDMGHRAVAEALRAADRVICLNPEDAECIARLLGGSERIVGLKPFIDTGPARRAAARRDGLRGELAAEHKLDPGIPWIAVTAMMRRGDKLASYRLLGEALRRLGDRPWLLLVAGDGEARAEIESALDFPGRVHFLGQLDRAGLDRLHAAADLGAWPAINEAYGMAVLAAQAAGLPLVAGDRPGLRQILRPGRTGLLTPEGDAAAFANAVARLLSNPRERAAMRESAVKTMKNEHDLTTASKRLDEILRDALHAVAEAV